MRTVSDIDNGTNSPLTVFKTARALTATSSYSPTHIFTNRL